MKQYNDYCSRRCVNLSKNSDPTFISKIKQGMALIDNTRKQAARQQTTLARYGVNHISKTLANKTKVRATRRSLDEQIHRNTFKQYNLDMGLMSDHHHLQIICADCCSYNDLRNKHFNHMPTMTILRHFRRIDFDPNYTKQSSAGEREIMDYLDELNVEYKSNDRVVIKPLELDIYIPSKSMAIEYNGLYWHSEVNGNTDKQYHLDKTLECEAKGIQLIHIYENHWLERPLAVKSYLRSKLGLNQSIGARETKVIEVDGPTSRLFCDTYHIQGLTRSSLQLGLVDDAGQLLSLATFGVCRFKRNAGLELVRFCSLYGSTVMGGLSKLLHAFREQYPTTPLLSYCDRARSNGRGYTNSGWVLDHITPPGYMYVKSDKTYSRQQFQKHKLTTLPAYSPTKTEWQIMQESGYDRIWDCGQYVFVYPTK
ncbi:MAG: hypothetical protein ACREQ5_03465 [Candidatus Dormibacteria bacterium]